MQTRDTYISSRGMTLIEVVIAAALLLVIFGGLGATFHVMVSLLGKSKAEAGALALANERLEYIRSLPYESAGTVGGIPSGSIAQNSTTTLNNIVYTERVLIEYYDAPEDGTGASDVNGILADYKIAKVTYSWTTKGVPGSATLISNLVPRGIETTAGGGTLTVNVFNANVLPVAGASVRVYNTTGTTSIDTTRYTNAAGQAMFSGAPALANYQIVVTKDGYSTDRTYSATTSNPNPITLPVAVLESEVSTMNFQIDALGSLTINTVGAQTVGNFNDTFNGTSTIASSTDIVVTGGEAQLAGSAGSYMTSGTLMSTSIVPSPLVRYDVLTFSTSLLSNTSAKAYVYGVTGTSTYTLIPDTYLPGNSSGFNAGAVSLRSIPIGTYPALALRAVLTSDGVATPSVLDWNVSYVTVEPALLNIPFTLTGIKTIGTTATASPIYKYQTSTTTNGSGTRLINNLEWDVYSITLGTGAYDISEVCSRMPYVLAPAGSDTLTLTLQSAVTRSLRVRVENASGAAIVGASATLSRSGFSATSTTGSCGQTFFNSGLSSAIDYQIDVTAPGYVNETVTDIDITGAESIVVVMST